MDLSVLILAAGRCQQMSPVAFEIVLDAAVLVRRAIDRAANSTFSPEKMHIVLGFATQRRGELDEADDLFEQERMIPAQYSCWSKLLSC